MLPSEQVDEMEEAAVRCGKGVAKLGRDIKAWGVWGWIKEVIDAFKRTMPLITDLRNPAMRQRHWDSLMEEIGTRCVLGGEGAGLAAAVAEEGFTEGFKRPGHEPVLMGMASYKRLARGVYTRRVSSMLALSCDVLPPSGSVIKARPSPLTPSWCPTRITLASPSSCLPFRFDPHSASFTLDSIIQLKLDQHVEFIAEMSVNATKELAIETNLKVCVTA